MKLQSWWLTGMWLAATAVCLGNEDSLTVVVLNYAGVETQMLERAAGLSRGLCQRMGVESTWLVCPRPEECVPPPVGTYVRMIVAPQPKGRVLGHAITDSMANGNPMVYAFHGPVTELALRVRYPVWMVLARVMVHEVLHLFGLNHTPHGIMRATIDSQELADLASGPLLVPSQVKRVRDGLAQLRPSLVAAR